MSVPVALASSVTFSVKEALAAEHVAATVAVTLPIESTAMLETVTLLSVAVLGKGHAVRADGDGEGLK
jgi:hypothetical protein